MLGFLKALFSRYGQDDIAGRAAALSYFAIFSIGPLLFLIFGIIGELLKNESYKQRLVQQMQELVGPQAGTLINDVVNNQTLSSKTSISFTIGIIGLVLGAIGIFGQLQKSLDAILRIKIGPDAGLKPIIKQKLISLGMVGVIIFMLLVSLLGSAVISITTSNIASDTVSGFFLTLLDFMVSVVVLGLLLTLFYRILPVVRLPWKPLFVTSLAVAVLFSLGKIILGLIIGNNSSVTAFGAAGSLIALLLWVFYSGQIIYLGAAGLSLYVERNGIKMVPKYKGERGVLRLRQVEEPLNPFLKGKLVKKFAKGFGDTWKQKSKK